MFHFNLLITKPIPQPKYNKEGPDQRQNEWPYVVRLDDGPEHEWESIVSDIGGLAGRLLVVLLRTAIYKSIGRLLVVLLSTAINKSIGRLLVVLLCDCNLTYTNLNLAPSCCVGDTLK